MTLSWLDEFHSVIEANANTSSTIIFRDELESAIEVNANASSTIINRSYASATPFSKTLRFWDVAWCPLRI